MEPRAATHPFMPPPAKLLRADYRSRTRRMQQDRRTRDDTLPRELVRLSRGRLDARELVDRVAPETDAAARRTVAGLRARWTEPAQPPRPPSPASSAGSAGEAVSVGSDAESASGSLYCAPGGGATGPSRSGSAVWCIHRARR